MNNNIYPQTIQTILEALRRGHPLPQTPLHDLVLRRTPQIKPDTVMCDIAVMEWLIQHIVEYLGQHRNHYHLKPPNTSSALHDALYELSWDFQQDSPELEAWSILDFYYVRVDLHLSWEQFDTTTAQSRRNLRRRRAHGLNRLIHGIIRQELLP